MNDKITTDIISTTGINITKYSSAKVFINGVEVTDTESWNKAISTFSELQDKINNLQSKIDKAIELNENIRKKLLTCSSYEKDKVEDLLFEQLDILKEDK